MTSAESTLRLDVAREFSRTPGPRRKVEGPHSGEEFLDLLRDRYLAARAAGVKLVVNFDGAAGYATSFLEAAFGQLAREYEPDEVQGTLEFESEEEPDLIDEVRLYIKEARLE